MLKKLMVVALAGLLFFGASNAMARVIGGWFVVGVESTDESISTETLSDICVVATSELKGLGYWLVDTAPIETRLVALIFTSTISTDTATLFCLANIFEEQSGLFGE